MAYIEPDKIGDPRSSPTDGLALDVLLPLAIGFLTSPDPDVSISSLKEDLRRLATEDPLDSLLVTVIGGGLAFYMAERDHNPACKSPWDGILYIATSLSVGYDNLFPATAAGHALAAAVHSFGPALADRAFDPPAAVAVAAAAATATAASTAAAASDDAAAVNRAILARLEDIVRLLEART